METNISKEDLYLFQTGKAQKAYLMFGCHYLKEADAHEFVVWAPNAKSVSLVGDFNQWNPLSHPMKQTEPGIYSIQVEGLEKGDLYKYYVEGMDGKCRYKSDPFAFYSEMRPDTASVVWDELDGFSWRDKRYLSRRKKKQDVSQPMSVYEMHLGTWKMPKEEEREFYNYREIADMLVPYLQKMGYTHVELMPVTEYPYDLSWGYQVTGYYSVTSRYGTPEDFMYFIDKLHRADIGVILDWVPAHFPRDEHGLALFDGSHIYDHADPRKGSQPDWGTLLFNYGEPEVQSFLISSAVFFAEKYHIDGIRIDAVSAMLYLDFGKKPGEFVPNEDGTNINYEAVDFLKNLNRTMRSNFEGFITVAEESTAFPKVTSAVDDEEGLGFTYKWNMGYMHDSLYYMELDSLFRKENQGAIVFSMDYAYSENYILPYSHDEVVHGKGSMINKMFGEYEQKFGSLKTLYGFMFAHPGKKLLFMGDDFAQFVEWRDKEELDWFLIDEYETHKTMNDYVAKLNELYCSEPALYELDNKPEGFEWLLQRDADHSIVAFIRKSKKRRGKPQEQIVCIFNFTPVEWDKYHIPMPKDGKLTKILDTGEKAYGGSGEVSQKSAKVRKKKIKGKRNAYEHYAVITLKPLSAVMYRYTLEDTPAKKKAEPKKTEAKKPSPKAAGTAKAEAVKTPVKKEVSVVTEPASAAETTLKTAEVQAKKETPKAAGPAAGKKAEKPEAKKEQTTKDIQKPKKKEAEKETKQQTEDSTKKKTAAKSADKKEETK